MARSKGLYKRTDSQFYWISYKDVDGKIIRKSTGLKRCKDAEDFLTDTKKEIKDLKKYGFVQPVAPVKETKQYTFRELAEKYLSWVKGRQRSYETKKYIVGQLLRKFGNTLLVSFNTEHVELFQTELMESGLANASCNKSLNILKHMFTKAFDYKMITEDTLKDIRRVKLLKEDNSRWRYLSKEEWQQLIDGCELHLKPIVITALHTGMRKSEILKLKWDNVDLRHGFINLDKTKNGESRNLPINATLRSTLTGINRRLDVPYVFFDPRTCKPYGDVKRAFHTAMRRAGITDFKFHDMRHTFASHLVMAGVNITTVSRLLGHKSLKMTLRYIHLAPKHLQSAVGVLDNAPYNAPDEKSTSRLVHVLEV